MEYREDVKNVLSGIELGLRLGGILGQVPMLNRFSLGSKTFRNVLRRFPVGDPIDIVTKVGIQPCTFSIPFIHLVNQF